MSSPNLASSARKSRFPGYRIFWGILAAVICVRILLSLSVVQRTVISLLGPPKDVPVPTLAGPDTIRPETVADVHLLEHWGNGRFRSMAWSPDGRFFAIGTDLGVNLYETDTFQLLRNIDLPVGGIDKLVFSPDGQLLAVAAEGGTLLVVDFTNHKTIQWEMGESIARLNYLTDGTLVRVMGMRGGNQRSVMRLVNGRWEPVKISAKGSVDDIAFVPEKQAFVVFDQDAVRLVEPVSGLETLLPYTVPHGGQHIFTHDVLITLHGMDNDLFFSSYTDGYLLKSIRMDGWLNQPTVSPDGRLLATLGPGPAGGYTPKEITLWELPVLKPVRTIPVPRLRPHLNNILFSPAGDQLAVLMSDSVVRIFSTTDPKSENVIEDPFAGIVDVAVTPDGEIRALRVSGTTLELIRLPSGTLVDRWHFFEPPYARLLGDAGTVSVGTIIEPFFIIQRLYKVGPFEIPILVRGRCCDSFSSDGSVGAAVGATEVSSGAPIVASIWQRKFGFYQEWTFSGRNDDFRIAVSPTGQYVAATGSSRTTLWINGIKSVQRLPSLGSRCRIAFSPDERYLASTLGILDLKTGLQIATETEAEESNYHYEAIPAFSPDGKIMAAQVNGLRFWQVSDGALLAKYYYPYATNRLVFSPDGRFLVGLGKGFINVWGISAMDEPSR